MLTLGIMLGYAALLLVLLTRKRAQREVTSRRWLTLAVLAALVSMALTLLPRAAHADSRYEALFVGGLTSPALGVIVTNLVLIFFGLHLLRYVQSRLALVWGVLGLAWWGAQAALSVQSTELSVGAVGWYRYVYDPVVWPNALAFAGWLVTGVVLTLTLLYAFYRARLPELANRALFGAVLIFPVYTGTMLSASGEDVLMEVGWLLTFLGLAGAVYSVVVYRVLDIRRTMRRTAVTGTLIGFTALMVFGALLLGQHLDAQTTHRLYLALGTLALVTAALYWPLHSAVQTLVTRILDTAPEGVARKLRRFTEAITGVVELDEVVGVTMHTLSSVLGVRRGGLILVSEQEDGVLLMEPMRKGLGEIPEIVGHLTPQSPVYERLVNERAPLLQYDLDFSPRFAAAPEAERRFFQALHMSAYAPIVVQRELIGILCCGAKASDVPFTEADLELMSTIANQAGVALRNARLVADLRRREAEQAALNKAISETKEQLERLDSVKTDFITIASHELRTPLAQIRGYTDIMEAMNEQGLLDQDQIAGMTANLRKASDRLEQLIGAMLDVSQLDVDAMDLRFAQISVEHCMRTAIEPLTEAIKNRRLMLSARGLRNLPPIQGDMQRLVQAFRNIVLNAIKYTPDGGRIDIKGWMEDDEIIIAIQDTGIGIAPENHELIFEKFFRAHDPSLHSTGATKFMGAGPGLGLTIARGVIHAHGGRIWVESEKYDPEALPGSTFYVALPLAPPEGAKRILPLESTVSLDVARIEAVLGGESGETSAEKPNSPTLPKPPAGWGA